MPSTVFLKFQRKVIQSKYNEQLSFFLITESTLILYGSSPDTRGSWPIFSNRGHTNYNYIKRLVVHVPSSHVCLKLYTLVCGMWYVVCGMWYVVCGMWYVVCGMW